MAEDRDRPGNTPVEQQERSPKQTSETRLDRLSISGPGAADFLTAQGGVDRPGAGGTKGTAQVRSEEGPLGEGARRVVPRVAPDPTGTPGEHDPDERLTGSQTGTIGGGGADAHNPSAVRATGIDDPIISGEQPASREGDDDQR